MNKVFKYSILLGINLIYACVSILTKYASQHEFLSGKYLLGFGGAIGVMAVYAVLWQQVLKHFELGMAYMFKGTSLVFVMILATLLFGEAITFNNIVGAAIIIGGIVLFSTS